MKLVLFTLLTQVFGDEHTPDKSDVLDVYQRARAISLDLRGVVPDPSEIEAINNTGTLDESMIDSWLQSEDFEEQAIKQHRSLFWNKANFTINKTRNIYAQNGVYYAKFLSGQRRGMNKRACTDYPAEVNEFNQPLSYIDRTITINNIEYSYRDEGVVEVYPWWDMENSIKLCAYDAQRTQISSTGTDCSQHGADQDPECGCGENLKWCSKRGIQTDVLDSMSTALTERVRMIIQADRPYSEMLTASTILLNGPLSIYYRERAAHSTVVASPLLPTDVPYIPFDEEDTWVEVDAGTEHAGVLTEPGWLLRHQTNRGRANRFYGAFLCKEFIPPPTGITELNEADPTPDLSRRPGCKDCHSLLEPWSASWGRWREVGSAYLHPDEYPNFDQNCYDCAINGGCSSYCNNNYLVKATHPDQEPFLGWYVPYVYLKQNELIHPNIGPKEWSQEIIDNGQLARCASQNAARWLLGWSDAEMQDEFINEWASEFTASGLNYRSLIRSIVTSPVYGRSK